MNIFSYLTSLVKANGIKAADIIDAKTFPFDEFSRPLETKYAETLKEKASKFESDLTTRFFVANGLIFTVAMDANGKTEGVGDQALWHGIATVFWATKR